MQPSQSAPAPPSAKRALLAALALLVLACVSAPAAFGLDPPDFTVDPPSPIACEQATFTSNAPPEETVTWQYGAGAAFVPEDTHTFDAEGTYDVTMNASVSGSVTKAITVLNAPPVAAFSYSPTTPDPDEWIVFTSTSTDCDDSIASVAWDFDEDGVTDSTDLSPAYKFNTPGLHDVTLSVTDEDDAAESVTQTVDVRDPSAPVAAFHRDPDDSVLLQTGDSATFTSDSIASAGSTLSWEIDGVVVGSGASVTHTFTTSGSHVVHLTVTQPNGKTDDALSSFWVNAPPTVAAPTIAPSTSAPAATQLAPAPKPALMSPFPTVRLVGFVVPRGARITLLEVRGAPRGARVNVRCTGRGCPFRLRRRIAETGRVRLSQFPRVLVAGAPIEVFVRAPGVIGKYVSFRIRAGRRPLRTDRCLMPGATTEPTRCT